MRGIFILVRQGTLYGPEYVTALINQLDDVVTLTDQEDTPGRTIPLEYGWPGWWAKMELFRPDLRDLRPFVFLDLDVLVVGDVSDLVSDELMMVPDFIHEGRGNSSVMVVPKDSGVWEKWLSRPEFLHGGDQEFIDQFPWRPITGVHSYRLECRDGPKGRIVSFHGKPKPHEAGGWAEAMWREYAGYQAGAG